MKKILFLVLALPVFFSCIKRFDDYGTDNELSADFVGSVWVEYEGKEYENEDITVTFIPSEDGEEAELFIHRIKFVPQMPVRVDTVLPVKMETDGTFFGEDNTYPYSPLGDPQKKYPMTGLKGEKKGQMLRFSLNFGLYPTRFSGVLAE